MVRTQIQLTEEQAKSLKRLAHSRHLSIAELIRQAVDSLIQTGSAIDIGERRQRAMALAGRFGSGRKDISQKHDDYLADAFRK
ncbi:MAG: ribbon-helix-helix protein, CopG family [Nitrospinae bacterium]|nr:ribbon-helix-helix protein, CopG family [Nitrospinota bacterium]